MNSERSTRKRAMKKKVRQNKKEEESLFAGTLGKGRVRKGHSGS